MPEIEVRPLAVEHLSREGFEPFGCLIAPEEADSPRFNRSPGNLGFLWVQKAIEFPKQPYMCTLRYYHRGTRCEFLQKHPESTIVLITLTGTAAIVAAPDGREGPAVDEARAFLLTPGVGVVINRDTWIRYAYPVTPYVDFAYVTQRVDPATANSTDDTVRANLGDDLGIVFDMRFGIEQGREGYEFGVGGAVTTGPERIPPWN